MSTRLVRDADFEREVISASEPVLVDFNAAWCGPCRSMNPIVEELAREYEGRVKFVQVDIDDNPESVKKFGIRSIPNIKLFWQGRIIDEVIGAVPKHELARRINDVLQKT